MNKKIITLGPRGTFSEAASRIFALEQGDAFEIEYQPSIDEVFSAFDTDAAYCVVPIENLSEGCIPLVLDNIERLGLTIVWEHLLPVRFSFVSKCSDLSEVSEVYVQFVARGQCSHFLNSLKFAQITTTQSNSESLNRMMQSSRPCGAIVSSISYEPGSAKIEIQNVTDRSNNATRFIALSRDGLSGPHKGQIYKTSMLIKDAKNRPGALSEILNCFASRGINLVSIVSRPTGDIFGEYSFYIDADGHTEDAALKSALDELSNHNLVRWLGSYVKSRDPWHDDVSSKWRNEY
ncbi:prephenate dehydratase [Burkholderia cenocepacia]|uniref:prephenate dehydratase n=1 Tax=Burkholderia cenocepacia TaxID=95486 RepID=UPI0009FC6EC2|nr:prephenate dehydratase domain-containing protein [Burkholderia cenocepacia]MDC6086091.1 ACT domain-containing protein [Burkholderia cenocepacia]